MPVCLTICRTGGALGPNRTRNNGETSANSDAMAKIIGPLAAAHLDSLDMQPAILEMRRSAFVLWRPGDTAVSPVLVIGRFQDGNPRTLVDRHRFALTLRPGTADVWSIDASACGLTDGQVYHYWFEVTDSNPDRDRPADPVHRSRWPYRRLAAPVAIRCRRPTRSTTTGSRRGGQVPRRRARPVRSGRGGVPRSPPPIPAATARRTTGW